MTTRTAATAIPAAVASALLLAGCGGPQAPKVADLTGKTFKEAKKIAVQAGYRGEFGVNVQSADAYTAPGSTNNHHVREFDEDDPAYVSWTVCSQDPSDLSSERDGSDWTLFLYVVEKPSDCKDGEITAEARKRYVAIAKQGEALANEPTADATADAPTEDSYRTIDDPDFTYTGDFTIDTGLPDPQERDTDGSYRYSLCEGSDYATAADCYPAEWQKVYEEYREEYGW
ncbi:PASTA domain-containing protein [Streptomyces sp. NPDC057545]|uniref:PASTA domain-containing protein n=1 Tax=unclassified Streptomyces TaxID=2593676 RepID=UPI00367C38D2